MRGPLVPIALGLALLAGCTSVRLRKDTVGQASTLTDLQYQQVLANLALFAEDPAALPWHINLREGTTQITDTVSGGVAVDLGPPSDVLPQLFGTRTLVAQWGVTPVVDPVELRLLRVAYRRAHGSPEMPSPQFLDDLARELKAQVAVDPDLRDETQLFFEYHWRKEADFPGLDARVLTANDERLWSDRGAPPGVRSPLAGQVRAEIVGLLDDLGRIRAGWFRVGRKKDVPKEACYVGHRGAVYVWVCPDGREALSEFTLTVLKLASLVKDTQTLVNPGSVKFSPSDR